MANIFDLLLELEEMEGKIAMAERDYHRQVAFGEEKQERAAKSAELATYRTLLPRIFNLITTGSYLIGGAAGFGGNDWTTFRKSCNMIGQAVGGIKEIDSNSTQGDRAEAQSLYTVSNELKRLVEQERQHAVGEFDKALQRMERLLDKMSQLIGELLR